MAEESIDASITLRQCSIGFLVYSFQIAESLKLCPPTRPYTFQPNSTVSSLAVKATGITSVLRVSEPVSLGTAFFLLLIRTLSLSPKSSSPSSLLLTSSSSSARFCYCFLTVVPSVLELDFATGSASKIGTVLLLRVPCCSTTVAACAS